MQRIDFPKGINKVTSIKNQLNEDILDIGVMCLLKDWTQGNRLVKKVTVIARMVWTGWSLTRKVYQLCGPSHSISSVLPGGIYEYRCPHQSLGVNCVWQDQGHHQSPGSHSSLPRVNCENGLVLNGGGESTTRFLLNIKYSNTKF